VVKPLSGKEAAMDWTSEQKAKLNKGFYVYGDNWIKISAYLNHEKSPKECYQRYFVADPNMARSGKWRELEDRRLFHAVKEHGVEDWQSVAKFVGFRSHWSCKLRWMHHIVPSTKRMWMDSEVERLNQAVNAFGEDWDTVAESIGTYRHPQDCRFRYMAIHVLGETNYGPPPPELEFSYVNNPSVSL